MSEFYKVPADQDLKHRLDQYFSKQRPLGVLVHVWISGLSSSRPPGRQSLEVGLEWAETLTEVLTSSDFCVLSHCQPSHHIPGCPGDDALPAYSMCTADAACMKRKSIGTGAKHVFL